MEGEGEVSSAWWPMEGEGEVSLLGDQWNVKEKPFSPLPTFPPTNSLKPSIFSVDLEVWLYHGPMSLPTPFLPFPWSINYECASRHTKSFTPSSLIRFCLKIWFFFLSLKSWRRAWSHITSPKPLKRMKNRLWSHL